MSSKKSIHTIAKELGVSATTISFIINGKAKQKGISEQMTKRVKAYLQKIGYKPNINAQSLRTGKTNIIGMLVEDISDPFFSAVARGVEIELEQSGYRLFLMSSRNKSDNAVSLLEMLYERRVDGFIIVPVPGIEKELEKLLDFQKPLVLFDRYFHYIPTCNVMTDNKGGVFMGVMELLNNSFNKIAFITLESDQIQMRERYEGYLAALRYANKDYEIVLNLPYTMHIETIAAAIGKFLLDNKGIDGLLFATNYLAVAGMHAIKELGLTIGQDIGIVGFDDNAHFAFFSPPRNCRCATYFRNFKSYCK